MFISPATSLTTSQLTGQKAGWSPTSRLLALTLVSLISSSLKGSFLEEMELYEFLDRVREHGRVSVPRIFRDRTCHFETLTDAEFKKYYRFSRHIFFEICEMVASDLEHLQTRGVNLTVASQVSLAIHLLGRNVMQRDEALIAGCSQPTVSRVVAAFVKAVNRRASNYIRWPSGRESVAIRQSFYRKYHIPGIVGVIDGTHCRILQPTRDEGDYVNRKGYHSLNVGIVVDYDMRVRWVCSKWLGSAHDSHVFKSSKLYEQLKSGELRGVLIGDLAYALERFLLKPLATTRNRKEERYNRAICSARSIVERAFALLKRQLYSPERAAEIVVACCDLRNIAIDANEPNDYDEYDGEDRQDGEVPSNPPRRAADRRAISFLEDLIEEYF
ncbi:hypothetical protein OSTOST_16167 [Ostertagia ostertagi]